MRSEKRKRKETTVNPLSSVDNDGATTANLLLLPSWFETLGNTDVKNENDVDISMSTLHRHLKLLGLFRLKAQSDVLHFALWLRDSDGSFQNELALESE